MQNTPTTGRPLEFDPDEVRNVIMRLFWEKGFSAVSLPDLESRTGLSRSSLYNSFGSKQKIFQQALERYRDAMGEQMCRPLETGNKGLADLAAFLDAVAEQFANQPDVAGCLLVNSMMEFGGEDDSVAKHSSGHLARLRGALIATLERAVALGELPRGNLAAKAELVVGLLLGISVAARAGLSKTEIGALVDAARTQIREWSSIAPKRSR